MHTSFTTDFLYILHLNRSTQLLLKMQYYLSNICFITVFCKICEDKLDVLGIKYVYLGAKYDCKSYVIY